MNYLYLWLNIGTLLGPFILSFDKKVAFYKKWKYLFPAILIMASVFITWDVLFTLNGVWGFNDTYLTGIKILHLPIEEWLFFFTVPYACIFIYECVNVYFKKDLIKIITQPFLYALSLILLVVGIYFYHQLYTSITFISTALFVLLHLKIKKAYLSNFLLSYFISLVPFLLVNGVLTGSQIKDQVVWYNPAHILNIRIVTIPIEDTIYNLLMLLLTITFYEIFKSKGKKNK